MHAQLRSKPGFRQPGLSRTERQYRLALRHSRMVQRLKLFLPLAAGVLIVGFFLLSWAGTRLPEGVTIADTSIEDGKLVMHNPVLTGETDRAQSYSLRARRAIQNLTNPSLIELEDISARLPVSDTVSAQLDATRGFFDREGQTMRFSEPFRVTTDDGMIAELEGAEIDVKAGTLLSDRPVVITTPDAAVVAQSMSMRDNGKTIVFENKVLMTIEPGAVEAPAHPAKRR